MKRITESETQVLACFKSPKRVLRIVGGRGEAQEQEPCRDEFSSIVSTNHVSMHLLDDRKTLLVYFVRVGQDDQRTRLLFSIDLESKEVDKLEEYHLNQEDLVKPLRLFLPCCTGLVASRAISFDSDRKSVV